jgi:hypothetical protein
MTSTKNKKVFFSTIWLLMTFLSAAMLIRGIWAMTQPWGLLYQKIFAWLFFFVCFMFSLYKFIASRTASGLWSSERMRNHIYGIMSVFFVLGGVFVLLIGNSKDRFWAIACILFFGLGVILYFRKVMKNKNG